MHIEVVPSADGKQDQGHVRLVGENNEIMYSSQLLEHPRARAFEDAEKLGLIVKEDNRVVRRPDVSREGALRAHQQLTNLRNIIADDEE